MISLILDTAPKAEPEEKYTKKFCWLALKHDVMEKEKERRS